MVMQFEQFVKEINDAVRALGTVERYDEKGNAVTWGVRDRAVDVALLPPLNVSVALQGKGQSPVTTWYPIDPALVPVVSRRIAAYLSEA